MDSNTNEILVSAAKELWQVWEDGLNHGVRGNAKWEDILEVERYAWMEVVKHIQKQSAELFIAMQNGTIS